jgi:hypothetical protein
VPLFRRKAAPVPPPSAELPSGEEVERSVAATLIHGKDALPGALYLTNRRLLFEARKGEARWMIVPYADVKSAGLYPRPHVPMGRPSPRGRCLVIETTDGEHVWWEFAERDEQEWLPLVQAKAAAAIAPADET